MMKQILVTISETGASRPQDQHDTFNKERFYFEDKEQVKAFLKERYGKLPNGKNKVYQDLPKLFNRKKLQTVKRTFKELNDYCTENDIVCDALHFESLLIDQTQFKTWPESRILNY